MPLQTIPGRPSTYRAITVAEGVRTAALRSPHKVALVAGDVELTYSELMEHANQVASAVAVDLGIDAGERVALLMPNCIEFVELVLGLAIAGVITVPVNARSSATEVSFVLEDSGARALFVHPKLEEVGRAAVRDQAVIVTDESYVGWRDAGSAVPPDVPVEEWDPFCLAYTAGTTGVPKGALLSHRSRALNFFAMQVEYGCFSVDDRTLCVAPLYHGAGLSFALAALFFGGTCIILQGFEPELVLRTLSEQQITNVFMVPSHFLGILALDQAILDSARPGDALRTIISNAAPMSQELKERVVDYFGPGKLFECYGSTEGGIMSNNRPADQLRKQACVGLAYPCAELMLVGDDGEVVGPGEVGEVLTRSPFMFNGYWERPEESETAFCDGWFRTGDLARLDDEGYLYIVDRVNDRIISGGINIYPREVEEALLRHPAVAEAAVYGVPHDYLGEAVHASVVLVPGGEPSVESLLEACDQLGRYKLPKGIEFVDELPRNAAGKVLRRQLRDSHAASAR